MNFRANPKRLILYMGNAMRKSAFERAQKIRRFRSSWAYAKYHPSLCYPFIYSVVSNNTVSGPRRSWSACADAQADLGLHCPHMAEDTSSHSAALMIFFLKSLFCSNSDSICYIQTIFVSFLTKVFQYRSPVYKRNSWCFRSAQCKCL